MGVKEDIAKFNDLDVKPVHEWGQDFYLRKLSADDYAKCTKEYDDGTVRQAAAFIKCGTVDHSGEPIFQWSELEVICRKDVTRVMLLAEKVLAHNNLTPDGLGDIEKN